MLFPNLIWNKVHKEIYVKIKIQFLYTKIDEDFSEKKQTSSQR
jgi:hypothetical protein